jgi:hypothetical protein
MLKQRVRTDDNTNVGAQQEYCGRGRNSNSSIDNPNSAKSTAISCPSEEKLRVPCYCEENVWRLAYRRLFGSTTETTETTKDASIIIDKENEQFYVVFVSNDERCCPMNNQRASKKPNELCFWDYHVILIQCSKLNVKKKSIIFSQVLDMDSRLSYPCTLDDYLNGTFKLDFIDNKASKKYSPKFRVVRAELFLPHFYSDRMHMYNDGKWSSPPPTYDCILTDLRTKKMTNTDSLSNLNEYISMSGGKGKESSVMGEVMSLAELRAKFEVP